MYTFYSEVLTPLLESISNSKERNAFCIDGQFYTYNDLGRYISKILYGDKRTKKC